MRRIRDAQTPPRAIRRWQPAWKHAGPLRGHCAHANGSQCRAPPLKPSRRRKATIVAGCRPAAGIRNCGNLGSLPGQRRVTRCDSFGHDCRSSAWGGTRRQPRNRTVCTSQKLRSCHQPRAPGARIVWRDGFSRHGTHGIIPAGSGSWCVVRHGGDPRFALCWVRLRTHSGGARGTVAPRSIRGKRNERPRRVRRKKLRLKQPQKLSSACRW